jgi:hypothetical protein
MDVTSSHNNDHQKLALRVHEYDNNGRLFAALLTTSQEEEQDREEGDQEEEEEEVKRGDWTDNKSIVDRILQRSPVVTLASRLWNDLLRRSNSNIPPSDNGNKSGCQLGYLVNGKEEQFYLHLIQNIRAQISAVCVQADTTADVNMSPLLNQRYRFALCSCQNLLIAVRHQLLINALLLSS